jgi:integrase
MTEEKQLGASADEITKEINKLIAHKRMGQREIYETLIAQGTINVGNEPEFKKLWEFLLSQELIDRGRIKNWNKKSGKLPKYFTKKQLQKIFEVVDRPKDGIACFLALMCGLRVREICRLQIKDIDLEQHKIFIGDSKNTNRAKDGYGTDRIVQFDSAIDNILKRWIEIIGKDSKWFLPSDKSPDTSLREKSLHERFRSYLKQASLLEVDYAVTIKQNNHGKKKEFKVNKYKYKFHCLRHTMACIIYNKTSDIYAVNQFLGHKQLDTTMVYAKITDTKMRNTISSVFSSLHNNYEEGEYLANHQQTINRTQSQPVVQTIANTPLQLLETQFINGDISENEFLRKKQVLEATEIKKVIEIKER